MDSCGTAEYVSVRLNPIGRTVTFLLDTGPTPRPGDTVVVRAEHGLALATVVPTIAAVAARRAANGTLAPVRLATREDVQVRRRQADREQEARRVAMLRIRQLDLPMKLSKVEQLFDGSKLVFYFTAEGRIDFRDLVRQLAADFKTRIEMRQIGVRDEARLLGGYGSCGRPLCCSTWLQSFEPVSIRMAKKQELALNPSKLSGLCGRLKCCLRYELPNGKAVVRGGCADDGPCGSPTGPGCGGGHGGACTSCRTAPRP